ncbi:MAG: GIY-YIG nuclease family protein, partial [Ilumatobacteraceae bacterium]
MNIGEVYFIGERDRSTGKLTENVKIGMVGAKGDSGERLKQHQTGNPRDLVLHHVVETPAPFWVENGLHQRLTGLRVRAEWHKLDPKGLEDAIRLAEVLASESFVHMPF